MTIPDKCIKQAAESLGGPLTQEKLSYIRDEMLKQQGQLAGSGALASPANVLMLAAKRFAAQQKFAAAVAKRNALLNQQVYYQRLAYVSGVWKGKETEGLRAVLTGSVEGRAGARSSAALEQDMLRKQYLGGLAADLDKAGVWDAFAAGSIDADVGRALWQLNSKAPNLDGLPADAVKVARVVHKYQELARLHANKAGANIGKLEGWIVRQSHDSFKIGRTEPADWIAKISDRLDWARMEAENGLIKDRAKFLRDIYQGLASGVHLKAKGATNETGFTGPRNIAKSMSQERVLHFKSADDWAEYNNEFGMGNLREAVFGGLSRSAQNTGLMRVLGPNPEAMLRRLVDEVGRRVKDRGDAKALQKFSSATKPGAPLWNHLAEIDGSTRSPVSHTMARYSSNIRAYQSMAKLGGAVISSITDLASSASELSFQGRGFLSSMAESVTYFAPELPKGERRQMLSSLGVFLDSMTADMTRQGSLDESFGGATSRMLQTFFKYNLLNWWTDSLRSGVSLSMSHHLGQQAGQTFDQLAPQLRHTLELFRVTADDWDHMRANGLQTASDGRVFLTADGLDEARGDMLRRYILDRSHVAVLEPDAGTRAAMRRGLQPGTWEGEIARFIGQFKAFPSAFGRQVLGREIFGRGEQAFAQGSIAGLSKIIVATTALGYAAMVAKDAMKGRTPRDPTDPATIRAAMLQGGGAGIYGDFLFGEYNRFGRTPLETLAGPTLGTASDTVRLWAKARAGDADAGDAIRLGINNAPFLNLFYTRIALDYLVLHDMQEYFAPGTLRRMESRVQRENGQTMFYSPAQDRLTPFTGQ